MGKLEGLESYLKENYEASIFDRAVESSGVRVLHLHNHRVVTTSITENLKYDIITENDEKKQEVVPKIHIKFLYTADLSSRITASIKTDEKIKRLALEPILAPGKRFHVKNKSLYPLMREKRVVFVTLLEGEIIKGIIVDFSRYEITLNLKGGTPMTILRHGIYDLRDKKGRCFLKTFQETHKDWTKSPFYLPATLNES